MTIKLPRNNIWKQVNLGNKFGDIWSSYNLDLSSKYGNLMVSPRMLLNISDSDDGDLGVPAAFKTFTTTTPDIWMIAGSVMWKTSTGGPNDPFAQDVTSGTPTNLNSDNSDMEIFNSALYVSAASTTMYKLSSGGSWSTISNALANSGGMHAMTFFRAQNRLYTVDDNSAGISSLNTSDTPVLSTSGSQYSLNDLVEGVGGNVGSFISCMESNSTRIWIGTINQSGTQCKVYSWDGSQASGPNNYYLINASGVLGITIVDDVPVIFDTRGRLLQLNGGTFVEIDRLPIEDDVLKLPVAAATSRPVHFNGMYSRGRNIRILINTQLWDTNSTNKDNVPSGIWEWTKDTGLYHLASVGHTKASGTIVDYGQQKLSLVGALNDLEVNFTDITQGSANGRMMAGARYYTDATTAVDGVFYDDTKDTEQKAGYFVTPKLFSPNIEDIWQQFYSRFRHFLNSTDKIVVKARTKDTDSTEATITYTSTTTFTVPTASFSTAPVVGDEVEILQGVGAGRTAHISSVTTSAPNYVVTVDETITGATTQTAIARFQTWKKLGSFSDQTKPFLKFPVSSDTGANPWVQFKVWILWTGKNEIYDAIISQKVSENIE